MGYVYTMDKKAKVLIYEEIIKELEKIKHETNILGSFIRSSIPKPGDTRIVILRSIIDGNFSDNTETITRVSPGNELWLRTNSKEWFEADSFCVQDHYNGLIRSLIVYDPRNYLCQLVKYIMDNPAFIKSESPKGYWGQDNDFNNWLVKKIKCPYSYFDKIREIEKGK